MNHYPKTSAITFQACDIVNAEAHNNRWAEPKHLLPPEARKPNESYTDPKYLGKNLRSIETELKELYKNDKGREAQKTTSFLTEAVALLGENNNLEDAKRLGYEIAKKLGYELISADVHNDEGHIKENGDVHYNKHAHLIFSKYNRELKMLMNSKAHIKSDTDTKAKEQVKQSEIKVDRNSFAAVQTMTANILNMERGISGSKAKHINPHVYREVAKKVAYNEKHHLTNSTEAKYKNLLKQKDFDMEKLKDIAIKWETAYNELLDSKKDITKQDLNKLRDEIKAELIKEGYHTSEDYSFLAHLKNQAVDELSNINDALK